MTAVLPQQRLAGYQMAPSLVPVFHGRAVITGNGASPNMQHDRDRVADWWWPVYASDNRWA
jgi:hypothetical protein